MRSTDDTRLECLKLANSLAQGKIIPAHEVQARAEEYFKWVRGEGLNNEPVGSERLARLKERFG